MSVVESPPRHNTPAECLHRLTEDNLKRKQGHKLVVVVQEWFRAPTGGRQRELETTLSWNLRNPAIDCVLLACDGNVSIAKDVPAWAQAHSSLLCVQTEARLTYRTAFELVNVCTPAGSIVAICNVDISFDESAARLRQIKWSPTLCLALLRHEVDGTLLPLLPTVTGATPFEEAWDVQAEAVAKQTAPALTKYSTDSQDAWVFQTPISIPRPETGLDFDYCFGSPGCDNTSVYQLLEHGYHVHNCCKTVRIFHLHEETNRTAYTGERVLKSVHRKYVPIWPRYVAKEDWISAADTAPATSIISSSSSSAVDDDEWVKQQYETLLMLSNMSDDDLEHARRNLVDQKDSGHTLKDLQEVLAFVESRRTANNSPSETKPKSIVAPETEQKKEDAKKQSSENEEKDESSGEEESGSSEEEEESGSSGEEESGSSEEEESGSGEEESDSGEEESGSSEEESGSSEEENGSSEEESGSDESESGGDKLATPRCALPEDAPTKCAMTEKEESGSGEEGESGESSGSSEEEEWNSDSETDSSSEEETESDDSSIDSKEEPATPTIDDADPDLVDAVTRATLAAAADYKAVTLAAINNKKKESAVTVASKQITSGGAEKALMPRVLETVCSDAARVVATAAATTPLPFAKVAVCVEPRQHACMSLVLEEFHRHLEKDWHMVVFAGHRNFEWMVQQMRVYVGSGCSHERSWEVRQLDVDNLKANEYSQMLLMPDFWEQLPGEHILIFQTDSLPTGSPSAKQPEDFFEFDYVGAPWWRSWVPSSPHERVGNGGLSLRKRSSSIVAAEGAPRNYQHNEDVYFSHFFYENPDYRVPSADVAARFSVETVLVDEAVVPWGVHKPWHVADIAGTPPMHVFMTLSRACPALRTLLQLYEHDVDHAIVSALIHNSARKPALVARLGTGEIEVVDRRNTLLASRNVGVSPPTDRVMSQFSEAYVAAVRDADVLAAFHEVRWFDQERQWAHRYNSKMRVVNASVLAYDGRMLLAWMRNSKSWFHALAGKRVLVVSPLRASILSQYEKCRAQLVFPGATYPEFASLQVVRAPLTQSMPGDRPEVTWTQHVARLKQELRDAGKFDVALLGCGGYAMPLAHFIKSELKHSAIVVGGVLQTYFGITGKRWEAEWAQMQDSELPTAAWVRPSEDERPRCFKEIEKGCYW